MSVRRYIFWAILIVQIITALFFVANILMSVLGFAPISWQISETIELGAAIGLLLGVVTGGMFLRATMRRNLRVEDQLRAAQGAFAELLAERFAEWGLTPAESDVALFAIKGMSTKEIAGMRDSSEGTVKAQTNAIYRKAGVGSRTQLLSLFIDDLMNVTPRSRKSDTN